MKEMDWQWKEIQRKYYKRLDEVNELKMERNQGCCYVLDEVNELKMERNQGCCYWVLDERNGLEMERNSEKILHHKARWNKWVENGIKIIEMLLLSKWSKWVGNGKKSEMLLRTRWNKWVGNGKKIRDAVTF